MEYGNTKITSTHLYPQKTERGCPSGGGGIKNGHIRYPLLRRHAEKTHPPTRARHLESIVGPGPQLEAADLVVEGEVSDVDLAGGPEADDGSPENPAVVVNHSQAGHVPGCVVVHAVIDRRVLEKRYFTFV